MSKVIKQASELPKWFNIEKYNSSKELNAIGWYLQIDIRHCCIETFDLYKNAEYVESDHRTEDGKFYNNIIEVIRDKPILDISKDEQLLKSIGKMFPYTVLTSKNPGASLSVRSLSANDYAYIGSTLDSVQFKKFQTWWSQLTNPRKTKELETPPYFDAPLYQLSYISKQLDNLWDVLWIDLDQPDNVLVEDFKSYLKSRRANIELKIENTNFYRKSDFDSWQRFGVLPYIDLKMWADEENARITNRVMADAIFPSGERGEETIRKTTKPLAEILLESKSRIQLMSQAIGQVIGQY